MRTPEQGASAASTAAGADEVSADARRYFQAQRLAPGTRVGRYVVGRELGHGGMGVVYEADDPLLKRKVALKWLLPHVRADGASPAENRLLIEAQALARLDHPNVVSAHDFGTHEGRVWLAMEFVDGTTLRRWMRQPRRWQEVMAVLEAVARGVAAAHAAGLVHRDLKPDNVMIARDGRVKVMDFGLARAEEGRWRSGGTELLRSLASEPDPSLESTERIPRLTRTGAAIGTPAYWAPELWDGRDADPLSDQFSWCVMAWEALLGRHPYTDESRSALEAAVKSGRRLPPPPGARIPGWLRRVLLRGLAVAPTRRHADMVHLLTALHAARWRHRAVLALGFAVPAFASVLLVQQGLQVRALAACKANAHETVAAVWNDATRSALRDGLTRTGASFAAVTADKIMPWLDAYAATWSDAEVAVCRHEGVDDVWRPELLTAARECLAERSQFLGTLLETIAAAGDNEAGRAVASAAGTAVASLPGIEVCLDERRLGARPRARAGQAGDAQWIRGLVTRAWALEAAGQYKEGLSQIEDAARAAETLDWTPLRAEVAHRLGSLQVVLGDTEQAERTLEEAYLMAGEAGEDEILVDTASALAFTVGYHLARHDDGIRWGRMAEMLLKRFGTAPGNIRWAQVLDNLGSVYQEAGQLDLAIEYYYRALGIAEAKLGPDHPDVVHYLRNLAWGYFAKGDYDRADVHITRAVRSAEAALGPAHPDTAKLLTIVGNMHHARGDNRAAITAHERVLAVAEAAFGENHPSVAMALTNLGLTHESLGHDAESIRYQERALRVRKATLGADHPRVARSLTNLGTALRRNGEYDRSIALNEEALAILERKRPPNHPDLLAPLNDLGMAYQERGELEQARRTFDRALGVARTSLGADHPNVAALLGNLASLRFRQGHEPEALEMLDEALRLREKVLGPDNPENLSDLAYLGYLHARAGRIEQARPVLARAETLIERGAGEPYTRAGVHFSLAMVLWSEPAERGRARSLAETALEEFASAGPRAAEEQREVEGWLRTHGGRGGSITGKKKHAGG